jgi:hypothetical protein
MPKPKGRVQLIKAHLPGSSSLRTKTAHHDPYGRRLQDFSDGRPRKFDVATQQRLREKFREQALRWKKHQGELPRANSKTIIGMVRGFAAEENVSPSWSVLRDRVVYPVLKELRQESD